MKDGGHYDGESKKCIPRRGLSALFVGEGMTLGNMFLTLLIVSAGLVSNQGSVYPALGPFYVITSF